MAYCLKKVGVRAIVTSEPFKNQNYYDMLCKIVPEIEDASDGIIKSKSSEFANLRTVIVDTDQDFP